MQWDPQYSQASAQRSRCSTIPAPDRVINLGYRFERGILEDSDVATGYYPPQTTGRPPLCGTPVTPSCNVSQVELSSAWPVGLVWGHLRPGGVLPGRPRRARELCRLPVQSLLAGACASAPAATWRARPLTSTARTGAQDTGISLQLELTGLASVGSASDTSLIEAIPGYTPPEAGSRSFLGPY